MLKEERERMSNDLATKGQELKNAMKDKMNSADDGEDLTKEAVYEEHQMTVTECAEKYGSKYSDNDKVRRSVYRTRPPALPTMFEP